MATQSLYRRYRPRRFSELKGQDHIVRALREAVRTGREGQAYLFSGPRGTGKTTTARILAKVLNCTNPEDGEPCCECESCRAVEHGNSYDVFELDAASNNSVEDIRNLIDKVSLGTPGRHKVYILDEVHMLSAGASAALLKVLEEPPSHVVFVLATTDPQKLKDTIRSRTQHLQFHLLPTDTLAEHVRWVASDAGIDIDDRVVDAALAKGGGSARDTLSALELLAATGGEFAGELDLDEFVRALQDSNTGIALSAVAHAIGQGNDPRTLCEDLLRHLRDMFLSIMSPELVSVRNDRIDDLAASARELGTATIVRAMERLGAALVEMRFAPDPRIMLEVALVQLTRDDVGGDASALAARLAKVEKALQERPTASPETSEPRDDRTGRAVIGGRAKRGDATGGAPRPTSSPPAPSPSTDDARPVDDIAVDTTASTSSNNTDHDLGSVSARWESDVRSSLAGMARALFAPASVHAVTSTAEGLKIELQLPSTVHAGKCEPHRAEVEQRLAVVLGTAVDLSLGVATASTVPEKASAIEDEPIDPSEVTNAPTAPMRSPEQDIADIFPGTRLVAPEE